MPTINQGSNATITIAAGMPIRITTAGEAFVENLTLPALLERLTDAQRVKIFGPFPQSVQLRITAVSGSADYGGGYYESQNNGRVLSQQDPYAYNIKTAVELASINTALAQGLASYPFGYQLVVDGIGYTLQGIGTDATFAADGAGNSSASSASAISSKYRGWFPLNQTVASGLPRDYAKGLSLYPMGNYNATSYWGTAAGKFSALAGTNQSMGAPPELNLAVSKGVNLLCYFELTKAAPASTDEVVIGNTDLTVPGFRVLATSAGKLKLVLRTTATGTSAASTTTAVDGTPHIVAVYLSGDQAQAFLYIDGNLELALSFPASATAITSTQQLGIGAYNSTLQTTYATGMRALGFIDVDVSVASVQAMVQRLSSYSGAVMMPFTENALTSIAKVVQALEIGQSNEYAASMTRFTAVFGYPSNNDGLVGNFNVREAEKIAMRRGMNVRAVNGSIGSSSLPCTYCGICKGAWATGVYISAGVAMTNAGNLYQCDDAIGALNPTTAAPTGTVASFTTADGRAWKYLGAANPAIDVADHVYRRGERGFDPKNQLLFYSQPAMLRVPNYDETWATIQIGQTDAGNNTISQTNMEDAYKSIIDYLLFYNVTRIYLGNTIYCSASGIDTAFQNKIFPARTAVLAFYAGNPKVFPGADLRVALGAIPTAAAVTDFVPGVMQLEPTGYHGNDYVYDRGAEARYQNKLALGHI